MNSPATTTRPGRKIPAPTGKTAGSAAGAASGNLSRQEIVFTFDNTNAKEVFLAGNFTDWAKAPMRMTKNNAGHWQAKVQLGPGRYHYKFLVDGEWRLDPAGREHSPNPFGTADSVVEVP